MPMSIMRILPAGVATKCPARQVLTANTESRKVLPR